MTLVADVLNSPAVPFLIALEHRGCTVGLTTDTLLIEPASLLRPEEVAFVHEHAEALAMLVRCQDPGVQARRGVMRRQMDSARGGRVPGPFYRTGVPCAEHVCHSCGEPLLQYRIGCCWRCVIGWRLAVGVPISSDLALDGSMRITVAATDFDMADRLGPLECEGSC